MSRVVEFDFEGAPPAQGGGDDYIPPGDYAGRVRKVEDGTTKNGGKRMITATLEVAAGDHKGSKLTDRFAFGNPGESKFPLQRWHAFLLACGAKINGTKVRLDLDALENRPIRFTVKDETSIYQGEEQTKARIVAYYTFSQTTAEQGPQTQAVTPPAPTPAPAPAPAAVAVADPPAAPAEAPAPVSAEAPAVEEVDIASVDDLFS